MEPVAEFLRQTEGIARRSRPPRKILPPQRKRPVLGPGVCRIGALATLGRDGEARRFVDAGLEVDHLHRGA